HGKAGVGATAAQPARRRHDGAPGRARHGIRHESRRPRGRARLRPQARGRRTGRDSGKPGGAGSLPGRRAMSVLIEAKNVSVSYGKLAAVKDVSLAIADASIATVIGPNGAGKTTLLKALMGQLPCAGEVRFGGDPIDGADVEERVERGIILVPETRELFAAMPVADNLRLGAYVHRRDRVRVAQDLDRVYALFPRLAERRAQLAGTLSGGERQMLALGRALMGRPPLLMPADPRLGPPPPGARADFS